jgi:arsenate reductase
MNQTRVFNVLFLCTGNSARSIVAESLLNAFGKSRFKAFSAGSFPRGSVHPQAILSLTEIGIPVAGLRSKSWDEFALTGAPEMDFVFTVCDRAAQEVCPVWPGHPISAHWGVEDPASDDAPPEKTAQKFKDVTIVLKRRIELLLSLPLDKLDRLSLQNQVIQIGKE